MKAKFKDFLIEDVLERISDPVDVNINQKYREIGIRSHSKGIFYKDEVLGSKLGRKRVFHIVKDCFIVNIVFAWEQAIAKTTEKDVGFIASHRFPMYKPKENVLDLDYILYFFQHPYGKHLLGIASPGGAGRNKTLGQGEFASLKISLPPITYQKKASYIINVWDKKIETQKSLISNLTKRKEWALDRLFHVKESWDEYKAHEIFNIEIGGTPSRNKNEYWGGNHPWISIRDIKSKYLKKTKEKITDAGVKNSSVKLFSKGSLVMSFKLSIGKKCILETNAYSNEAICCFEPNGDIEINIEFIYYLLDRLKLDGDVDNAIKGKTLNKKKLNNLSFYIPSIGKQNEVALKLNVLDEEIHLNQKKYSKLVKQRTGLLDKLLFPHDN